MVAYHHVAGETVAGEKECDYNNLALLFARELEKDNKSFKLSYGMEGRIKEGTLLKHIEKCLSTCEWRSFEEWSWVSSKFVLARSSRSSV